MINQPDPDNSLSKVQQNDYSPDFEMSSDASMMILKTYTV